MKKNYSFEFLPDSLRNEIQVVPKEILISILKDVVEIYKRKAEDQEIDAILLEAEEEMKGEKTISLSTENARKEFMAVRNQILQKYF